MPATLITPGLPGELNKIPNVNVTQTTLISLEIWHLTFPCTKQLKIINMIIEHCALL